MKADRKKLELAMARSCINKVITGHPVRTGTMGRIARALGVDVTEILADEY